MGLLVETQGFMLSGVALGCCVGTWRKILLFMSWLGSKAFFGSLLLVLSSAASLGFSWDSDLCVWLRPGLPALCQVSRPFQFFRKAVWDAWRTKVAGDLSSQAGFRGGRYLDLRGSLELLSSSHLGGGDEGLLRGILFGRCLEWISSRLCQRRNRSLSFLWRPDGDGHLFWECPHLPFVHVRESPEFHDLLSA